jgi:hypothetical protein
LEINLLKGNEKGSSDRHDAEHFLSKDHMAGHHLPEQETSFFRSRVGLSVEVTGLDFIRRFTDALFVDPTKTLFE